MRVLAFTLLALMAAPAAALTILDTSDTMEDARENGQPYLRYTPSNISFRVEVDRTNMMVRVPNLQTTWGLTPQGDYIAEEERTEVTIIPPSDPFDVETRIETLEGWKAIMTWSYADDLPEYGPMIGAEGWSPIIGATGDAPYVTWPAVSAAMPDTIESKITVNVWQWEDDYANRYLEDQIDLGTVAWIRQEGVTAPLKLDITGTPRWPAWKLEFETPKELTYLPEEPVEYTITDRWGEAHTLTRTHMESWLRSREFAFLPIPEPSTLALGIIAIAAIPWWRGRFHLSRH